LAVLLLERPEQPARLIQVRVVGPAVQGSKALLAFAATAAAVGDAVGAGGMPRHADEERAVVAVIGRPPVLRRRHQLDEIPLQRLDIEGLELFCVVEVVPHRIGQVRVVVEYRKVELIRPPVIDRPRSAPLGSRAGDCRALALADTSGVLLVGHATFSSLAWAFPWLSLANVIESEDVENRGLPVCVLQVVGSVIVAGGVSIGPTSYLGYNDRV